MGNDGTYYREDGKRLKGDGILADSEAVLALYHSTGSFYGAAKLCDCSAATFRRWFLAHGHVPEGHSGHIFWGWMMKRAYKKVSRIPDKCPRNCPGLIAEPDCTTEGMPCYFDPEQVPLDTTGHNLTK